MGDSSDMENLSKKTHGVFSKASFLSSKTYLLFKSQFLEVPYLLFEFGESVFQEPVALCPPIQQESQHINHSGRQRQ